MTHQPSVIFHLNILRLSCPPVRVYRPSRVNI
ncbi:DUF547 domain-containing protein [Bowmanella sp. Y57]|uniref:DUF547 domain-containing protein n=1 Tax=Bowmanella yangjiangensis TaxID=2811230 RepID=A0ABS3CWY0_9ALTE|nr:DUF547 domain-containing protein [Bowmanella yangjiangensis]